MVRANCLALQKKHGRQFLIPLQTCSQSGGELTISSSQLALYSPTKIELNFVERNALQVQGGKASQEKRCRE
jgi:hypothetical protein